MSEIKAPPIGGVPAAPAIGESTPEEPVYVPVDDGGDEPDVFEAYKPGDIAGAEQRLRAMKPADLLGIERLMTEQEKALDDRSPFPEACGIAFTEIAGKKGTVINVTSRGRTPIEALDNLVALLKHAGATYDLHPVHRGVRSAEKLPVAQQQQGQDAAEASEEESGTGILNQIVVRLYEGKLRTEFSVGKFKYPFGDSRKPDTIAGCFDKSLGWTAKHFDHPAVYTPDTWGGDLYVDWVKKGKYYNVVKVHA